MKSIILITLAIASTLADAKPTHLEPIMKVLPSSKQHQLDSFAISQYEVTVAEFQLFVEDTQYQVPQKCFLFSSTDWPSPEKPGNWEKTSGTWVKSSAVV